MEEHAGAGQCIGTQDVGTLIPSISAAACVCMDACRQTWTATYERRGSDGAPQTGYLLLKSRTSRALTSVLACTASVAMMLCACTIEGLPR